jgi:hypothetical protein
MNSLPTTSFATRLNAFAAAAVVTLSLLVGIDAMALNQTTAQLAQGEISATA